MNELPSIGRRGRLPANDRPQNSQPVQHQGSVFAARARPPRAPSWSDQQKQVMVLISDVRASYPPCEILVTGELAEVGSGFRLPLRCY